MLRPVVIATGIMAVTIALLPAHAVARRLRHPSRKVIEVAWHRAVCKLMGIKVTVHGAVARPQGHGVFIAANHVSWIDIVALGSVAPVSFVAKDEVKSWPVFGILAKWQDSVFVDRETRSSAGTQAAHINARLMAGDNIVLFPEGTTSDGNFIYPFKSSLFGALGVGTSQLKSPVQPVAIAYTRHHGMPMGRHLRPLASWPGDVQMMPHLLRFLRAGAIDAEIAFGEPIAMTEGMNRKQLATITESRVRDLVSASLRGRHALPRAPENR